MASKRYKKLTEGDRIGKSELIEKILPLVKKNCTTKFDESIDLNLQINNKQKKGEINLRTIVNMPSGIGKKIKVAVVCEESKNDEAKSSGADIVGGDEFIEKIKDGNLDFEKLICTPSMMVKLSKLGKILGPKGLMPNPKLGSVTNDIKKAITNAKSGQVEIKNDNSSASNTIPLRITQDANDTTVRLRSRNTNSSGDGVRIDFDRDEQLSDDETIARLRFRAENSAGDREDFADMFAIASDVTDGDEGGLIKFRVSAGGLLGTAALKELLNIGGEDQNGNTRASVVINEDGTDYTNTASRLSTNLINNSTGGGTNTTNEFNWGNRHSNDRGYNSDFQFSQLMYFDDVQLNSAQWDYLEHYFKVMYG